MAEHVIRMPDVGEGVVEAEIVAWHVKVGDTVEEDEDVVDVMTDKATVEIPSPVSGKIIRVNGAPGDLIAVGSEIIVIETDADADASDGNSETKAQPEAQPEPPTEKALAPEPSTEPVAAAKPHESIKSQSVSSAQQRTLASPAVRQRALELDIELGQVQGSGPAGRILRQDLEDFIAAGGRAVAKSHPASSTSGAPLKGSKETKIIGLRRKIARNMEKAWTTPLITYVEEIDVSEVEELRAHLNAKRASDQPKLTLIPFLAKALIAALKDIPQANSHYFPDEDRLVEFEGVHLGVATATDNGLVVPVLHHAEAMSIWDVAGKLAALSKAAREGKASRDDLTGSSITITSLGAIGGLVTTPLLNPPETSIIGVNKIVERAVFDGSGRVVPRKFMNLSSSFDHRIVDGYDAAMLIQGVRDRLEHPATLFMQD